MPKIFVNFDCPELFYIYRVTNNSGNQPVLKTKVQGTGAKTPPTAPEIVNIVMNGLEAELS